MSHPMRQHIHQSGNREARIAETIVSFMGSMRFIKLQTAVVFCWVLLNATGLLLQWDRYPFILLNLAFSTQAAYAAPFILLAGNTQAEKDKKRDDTEALEVEQLLTMNSQQLEILRLLRTLVNEEGK